MSSLFCFLLSFPLHAAEPGKCPAGIGASAGDAPLLQTSGNGFALILCGYENRRPDKPDGTPDLIAPRNFSEFDIYSLKNGKISKPILKVGARKNYWVFPEKQGLLLTELGWAKDQYFPVFNSHILCGKAGCRQSQAECGLNQSSRDLVKELRKAKDDEEGNALLKRLEGANCL